MDEIKIRDARNDISYLQNKIYVDNAAVSPVPTRVQLASEEYNRIISDRLREAKEVSRPHFERGRALAAKLVGTQAHNIAYIQNTSHGLSLVAIGLDWRPGDNLVVCAQEFPSNYLCWVQLEAQGVEIRRIASADGRVDPCDIRAAIDNRTRLVALSHVQFYSGFRADIASIAEVSASADALLVVDGTQSIGALGLDVRKTGVDVLVVSAHKWLMGPRGIGFAAFSDRALDRVKPRIVGWLSVSEPFEFHRTLDYLPGAARFEPGTANGCGVLGLAERLAQIDELGIDWIEDRILDLSERLCEGALRQGIEPAFRFKGAARSGITILRKPSVPPKEMLARLLELGVYASIRSEGIRISPHYYNTREEMDGIISMMAAIE